MALPEEEAARTSDMPTLADPRRSADDLQNDEERFRTLFENSIDAVLLINTNGTIEAANPEARRLFDRTDEEVSQLSWMELVDPTDTRLKLLVTAREQTGRFRGELNCRRKNGSVFV